MSKRGVALGVLVAVTLVGLVTWAVVAMHNWEKACHEMGGSVDERYEYTAMDTTYTYDAKGNVTGVIITPRDVYSYHCMVNGQEVDPDGK